MHEKNQGRNPDVLYCMRHPPLTMATTKKMLALSRVGSKKYERASKTCILTRSLVILHKTNFTGRLFSTEHNRWFATDNTPLQILRDNNKRLTLTARTSWVLGIKHKEYALILRRMVALYKSPADG